VFNNFELTQNFQRPIFSDRKTCRFPELE